MPMTTSSTAGLITPQQAKDLILIPLMSESVALQTSTAVPTTSKTLRFPRITADPVAAWTAEGDEIDPSLLSANEFTITPAKLAGLTILSNELVNDSDPAALEQVGAGLARDIARQLDAAFYGSVPAPAPSGLADLAGVNDIDAGDTWTSLDPFLEAIADAEQNGAPVTSFVAAPADALALAKIKEATGSQRNLLQPDPTSPTKRTISGVPLWVSPAVAAGVVWGYSSTRAIIAVRQDVELATDSSVFFTSDRSALRAIVRVGWGYPQPAAIQKIALTP